MGLAKALRGIIKATLSKVPPLENTGTHGHGHLLPASGLWVAEAVETGKPNTQSSSVLYRLI